MIGRGSESVAKGRRRIREDPGRRGIPRVLDGGVVVGGDAIDDVEAGNPCRGPHSGCRYCPRSRCARMDRCQNRRPGRVISHLRESTDMIGDGAAVKEADRRHHHIVVGAVRCSRRRQRRLRVGEADDRHHRDRRHPRFFVGAGVVRREQRAAVLAAARRVAADLEKTAVRRQAGKIGVAGAARLAGLPGVARQGVRRRCVANCENTSKQKRRSCGYQPAMPRGRRQNDQNPPSSSVHPI